MWDHSRIRGGCHRYADGDDQLPVPLLFEGGTIELFGDREAARLAL
jgi:hypothetical protein